MSKCFNALPVSKPDHVLAFVKAYLVVTFSEGILSDFHLKDFEHKEANKILLDHQAVSSFNLSDLYKLAIV